MVGTTGSANSDQFTVVLHAAQALQTQAAKNANPPNAVAALGNIKPSALRR